MFYPPGIAISSVNTSEDEIKFTLNTKSECLRQKKNVKLFMSNLNIVGTEFPHQTSRMDTFSIPIHCSSHAIAWE